MYEYSDFKEIKSFIDSFCRVIIESTPANFEITEPIKFNLTVICDEDSNGKINLKLITIGQANYVKSVQQVQFQYDPVKAIVFLLILLDFIIFPSPINLRIIL